MNKKVVKSISIGIALIIVIGFVFVIADYFSLFGTTTKVKMNFVEARFKTLDAETGALVLGAGVRCTQKGIENACTRRDSHRAGIVSVHIPLSRVIEKTLLFNKSETFIKSVDPKIHIMLMHQDYHNPISTIDIEDIYLQKKVEYTVKMKPRVWNLPEEEEDE